VGRDLRVYVRRLDPDEDGWTPGRYAVDVYLDQALVKAVQFTVR
jgi:hypothetical protein